MDKERTWCEQSSNDYIEKSASLRHDLSWIVWPTRYKRADSVPYLRNHPHDLHKFQETFGSISFVHNFFLSLFFLGGCDTVAPRLRPIIIVVLQY